MLECRRRVESRLGWTAWALLFLASWVLAPLSAEGGVEGAAGGPSGAAVRFGSVELAGGSGALPVPLVVDSPVAGGSPSGSSPVTLYQLDDGEFESATQLLSSSGRPFKRFELAQRFRLTPGFGTVDHVVVYPYRSFEDPVAETVLQVTVYESAGGVPGEEIASRLVALAMPVPGQYRLEVRGVLAGAPLDSEEIWVGVLFRHGLLEEHAKWLAADTSGAEGAVRAFRKSGGRRSWYEFDADKYDPGARAGLTWGIRLGVRHHAEYTDCTPGSPALVLSGGYEVSACFETASGLVGPAAGFSGVSGESGLLWFFEPGNAEMLVKVLDFCAENGHRWVFASPVTDVAFNLEVRSPGGAVWSHHNRVGRSAPARSDTRAFPCGSGSASAGSSVVAGAPDAASSWSSGAGAGVRGVAAAGSGVPAGRERSGAAAFEGPPSTKKVYRYDDGTFEEGLQLADVDGEPAYSSIFFQRFRVDRLPARVEYVEVCKYRTPDDPDGSAKFTASLYSSIGLFPSGRLGAGGGFDAEVPEADSVRCIELRDPGPGLPFEGFELEDRDIWVSTGVQPDRFGNAKLLAADTNGPGGPARAHRVSSDLGGIYQSRDLHPAVDDGISAYGIRLAVDHFDPAHRYTDCVPGSAALTLSGGYEVSMCYETPAGVTGDGFAGVWSSGSSGLVSFFDRGNAELLIKVLDGCGHNGHLWVFAAPATYLAFNLYVTSPDGRRWRHHNRQGELAETRNDTRAFPCGEE